LLKKNISDLWVKHFTQERDDVVFMDTAIIAHPTTWQASGHLASFSDALIDDKKTGKRFRADKIIEDFLEKEWKRIRESDPNWSREIDEHHQESLEIIRKYHNQD
jgi:glycine--tRNA ligase